jgi:hypothetical protein
MPSELQQLIFMRKELIEQPKSFKTRRSIRKIDKRIKKVVRAFAKEHADKVYEKMYELCYSVINANFQ